MNGGYLQATKVENGWIVGRHSCHDNTVVRWVFTDAKSMGEFMAKLDDDPFKRRDAP